MDGRRPLVTARSQALYAWASHGASPEMVQVEARLTEIARKIKYGDPTLPPEPSGEQVEQFQERLGHAFSNRWLLRLALVHSSAAPETDNASLAWLGDAALGLMTTEHIMAALGAGTPVGQLTKARERLVSRQECVRQARSIGLDQVLVIGQGMAGQMSQNMLAEAYEAVVGAVYTDGGFEAVRKVYLKHFPPIQQLLAAAQPGGVEGN